MARSKLSKLAKKRSDECTIPPEPPKEQLHKLMFRQSKEEADPKQ